MVRPLLPVIDYYVNYDYIAEELCINKDKPYLECNGRGYLNAAMERVNGPAEKQQQKSFVINWNDYPISTLDFHNYQLSFSDELLYLETPKFSKNLVIKDFISFLLRPPIYI